MSTTTTNESSQQQQQFSSNDLDILRKVWYDITCTQSNSFGANLFLRLFELHPNYLTMFGFSADQSVQDATFRKCTKLAAHGANVMYILNMTFDNLDDLVLVDELLHKLVISHVRRGIEPHMFDHIVQPFADLLNTCPQFNPQERDVIKRAFLYIKNRIQHLYEDVNAADLFDDDSSSNCSDTELFI